MRNWGGGKPVRRIWLPPALRATRDKEGLISSDCPPDSPTLKEGGRAARRSGERIAAPVCRAHNVRPYMGSQ